MSRHGCSALLMTSVVVALVTMTAAFDLYEGLIANAQNQDGNAMERLANAADGNNEFNYFTDNQDAFFENAIETDPTGFKSHDPNAPQRRMSMSQVFDPYNAVSQVRDLLLVDPTDYYDYKLRIFQSFFTYDEGEPETTTAAGSNSSGIAANQTLPLPLQGIALDHFCLFATGPQCNLKRRTPSIEPKLIRSKRQTTDGSGGATSGGDEKLYSSFTYEAVIADRHSLNHANARKMAIRSSGYLVMSAVMIPSVWARAGVGSLVVEPRWLRSYSAIIGVVNRLGHEMNLQIQALKEVVKEEKKLRKTDREKVKSIEKKLKEKAVEITVYTQALMKLEKTAAFFDDLHVAGVLDFDTLFHEREKLLEEQEGGATDRNIKKLETLYSSQARSLLKRGICLFNMACDGKDSSTDFKLALRLLESPTGSASYNTLLNELQGDNVDLKYTAGGALVDSNGNVNVKALQSYVNPDADVFGATEFLTELDDEYYTMGKAVRDPKFYYKGISKWLGAFSKLFNVNFLYPQATMDTMQPVVFTWFKQLGWG